MSIFKWNIPCKVKGKYENLAQYAEQNIQRDFHSQSIQNLKHRPQFYYEVLSLVRELTLLSL